MICKTTCTGLAAAVLIATFGLAATEKRISLRFTPKENVTANLPTTSSADPTRSIEVFPLTDARSLTDLSLVGENRERKTARPVRATSSVAAFSTTVLKKCLADWGVRLGPSGLVLKGEITNLWVAEENTYSTQANVRFKLEGQDGAVLWEGIAVGDAHQWGRSFSEENYNEQISDALKKTFANLLSNPGFQAAWSGERPATEVSVEPLEVKARVLELMKAGVGDDVIESYLRGVKLSRSLNATEIVEWKRSGISDRVIRAAVERR
jgi:hypothetical protein